MEIIKFNYMEDMNNRKENQILAWLFSDPVSQLKVKIFN